MSNFFIALSLAVPMALLAAVAINSYRNRDDDDAGDHEVVDWESRKWW